MKAIKVNADYEAVLFKNKSSVPVINQALEFLALFLEDRPLYSSKTYPDEFLSYIEELTGNKPEIIHEGEFENWWGALENIELEQRLNSKEMSTLLNLKFGWCLESRIISSLSDIPDGDRIYLAKNPHGMSGQNFSMVSKGQTSHLEPLLKKGKIILEPFLERTHDFSHFIFPNGVRACYENLVDKKFQYRGSIFNDYTQPDKSRLSFHSLVSEEEWVKYDQALDLIVSHYQALEMKCGFSVDSFIYEDHGVKKIRFLSEVNYRKTMGQIAFMLSLKYGGLRKWSSLVLVKSSGLGFSKTKEKLESLLWGADHSCGVIILSPGDTRYDMYFLSALDEQEGAQLSRELARLLSDSEFPIKF